MALYLPLMTRFVVAVLVFVAGTAVAAPTCLGPTPYVKKADSPFDLSNVGVNFFFDDFESDTRVTGAAASSGSRIGPQQSSVVDSVDEDDGTIDGSGLAGHSWFSSPGSAGIRFTFDAGALGGLPTAAGIVWTDGIGTVSFEAVAADGVTVICQSGPLSDASFPDGSITGQTAEDRFFGLYEPGGISSIFVSNTDGGIEVDHLQFGAVGLSSTTTPVSTTTTTTTPGQCVVAPTYSSILCRIDALLDDVNGSTALGRSQQSIANALAKARKQVAKAQGGSGKVAKNQLKKAAKSLETFRHKLDSHTTKRIIPKPVRDDFRDRAAAIKTDVGTLRATL